MKQSIRKHSEAMEAIEKQQQDQIVKIKLNSIADKLKNKMVNHYKSAKEKSEESKSEESADEDADHSAQEKQAE